jgi:hypothetical protein
VVISRKEGNSKRKEVNLEDFEDLDNFDNLKRS